MARFAIVVQGGQGIESGVREGRRGPEADTAKGGNKEKEEPAAFDVGVNLKLHYPPSLLFYIASYDLLRSKLPARGS